ncbi:hypothetical protein QQ008_18740 [Fulvivirgaceae bacterium BMA10]|uniref:Uncharacterized protein n=1 Tax=Splendidivirga corallicola TaxID=3051826 RepID=A0ABT8KRQ1_9BACT|nr:hypothetical protein [Fulvivirgaceae bacterium BMA10]
MHIRYLNNYLFKRSNAQYFVFFTTEKSSIHYAEVRISDFFWLTGYVRKLEKCEIVLPSKQQGSSFRSIIFGKTKNDLN